MKPADTPASTEDLCGTSEERSGLPERMVHVRNQVDMDRLNGYLLALLPDRPAASAPSASPGQRSRSP